MSPTNGSEPVAEELPLPRSTSSERSPEGSGGLHAPKPTRRLFLAVSLLMLAVYLVSGRGLPMTFDDQLIFDTTAALVHGRPNVTTPLLRTFPDLAVKRPDGKLVGIYGLGTSIAGAPMYVVGQLVAQVSPPAKRARVVLAATMFTDAVIVAATVFMLMMLCLLLGAPPLGAVLIGLSYGLGSYAYPNALTMYTEPGTALCLIAAVYWAIRASRSGARVDLLTSGAWAGAALLFRVSAVLFLPLLGLWLLVVAWRSTDSRRVGRLFEVGAWFSAGAAGPLLLLLLINWWRYGDPTNFGYALGTATSQSYPILRGVAGQWFSSGKSLFLYAPLAFIVCLGLFRSFRSRPAEMTLLASIVLVNTLFFARIQFWSGDWAWGPRYMQIVVPCLAAMAAPLVDSRAWRRALGVVSILGLVFAALPAVLVRDTYIFWAAYRVMPPPTVLGPPVWDHSYYALIWHTYHWQPILYQLRLLPKALTNSMNHVTSAHGPRPVNKYPGAPRFEFWWLRARDLGATAVALLALLPVAAIATGMRVFDRYLGERPQADSSAS